MRVVARIVAIAAILVASRAAAQAVVDPNQITGTVGFTNTEPRIVAKLGEALTSGRSWKVTADSVDHAESLHHYLNTHADDMLGAPYELTVETAFVGIAYDVYAEVSATSDYWLDRYYFAPARSQVVNPEPAPDTPLSLAECAGLVRVHWLDGLLPFPVTSATLTATRPAGDPWGGVQARTHVAAPGDLAELLVRGDGQPFTLTVRYTTGTDPYSDIITYEWSTTLAVGCDEVLDLDHDCRGDIAGASGRLGSIVGTVDLVGESERSLVGSFGSVNNDEWTSVSATGGPWWNYRWDLITGFPACGAFELENLVASRVTAPPTPYDCVTRVASGTGREFQLLDSPVLQVPVQDGVVTDVGNAFVMVPTIARTDLVFHGPPALGGLRPMLSTLRFADDPDRDRDGDGVPESFDALRATSCVRDGGTTTIPTGARTSSRGGYCTTAFPFSLSPDGTTGTGLATSRIAGLYGEPSVWGQDVLLTAVDTSTPDVPPSYVFTTLDLADEDQSALLMTPGGTSDVDMHACLSEVFLTCISTNAPFFSPSTQISRGSFFGIDFEGRRRRLRMTVSARGTPLTQATASNVGLIAFLAGEGNWTFDVAAQTINPGGGTSTTEFEPITAKIGCRQRIVLRPDLGISMEGVPPCLEAGIAHVRGHAEADLPIARIEVSADGGPATLACADCGTSADWSADLPVMDDTSQVVVTATDTDGNQASVTGFARYAPELAALDRRAADVPLRVGRATGMLRLTWEPVPGFTTNVYRGTIASLHAGVYDHHGAGTCALSAPSADVDAAGANAYFLVATSCGWGDSSLGRDAFGRERPGALMRCP